MNGQIVEGYEICHVSAGPTEQQLEDLWDDVSTDLSAIFQGRGDLPDDVTPFDAASEVDIQQQR